MYVSSCSNNSDAADEINLSEVPLRENVGLFTIGIRNAIRQIFKQKMPEAPLYNCFLITRYKASIDRIS